MIDIEQVRHALPSHQNELIMHECIRLLAPSGPPAYEDVLALCRAYYLVPGNEAGGALHIVLDDGNIEDDYITWCQDVALKVECVDDGRPVDPAGWLLARLLLRTTEDQRQDLFEDG